MAKGQKIGEAYIELRAEDAKLKKGLKKLEGDTRKAGNRIGSSLGAGMAKGFAAAGGMAAILGFIKGGITRFLAFDKAMRNVNTIMKLTGSEFRNMSKGVRDLSKAMGTDATEIANGLYQAASAGIAAGDAMAFMQTAVGAAKAGVATTVESVDLLTTVLNAWSKDAKEAENVADVLFTTVELGKTSFSELASGFAIVASQAASSGVTFEQVASAISTLTKSGTKTAVGFTQIRGAILGFSKVLGDGWAKTMTFNQAAEELSRRTGGSSVKMQALGITIEGVGAILGTTGGKAIEAGKDFARFSDVAGAKMRALKEQTKAYSEQLALVTTKWDSFWDDAAKGVIISIAFMIKAWKKAEKAYKQFLNFISGTGPNGASGGWDKHPWAPDGKTGGGKTPPGKTPPPTDNTEANKRAKTEAEAKKATYRDAYQEALRISEQQTQDEAAEGQRQLEMIKQRAVEAEEFKTQKAQEEQAKRLEQQQAEAAAFESFVQASANAFDAALADIGVIAVQSTNLVVQAFGGMANAIIAQIKRMIAQWLAWQVITGLFSAIPGGAAFFASIASTGVTAAASPTPTPAEPRRTDNSNDTSILQSINSSIQAGNANALTGNGGSGTMAVAVYGEISGSDIKLISDVGSKQLEHHR